MATGWIRGLGGMHGFSQVPMHTLLDIEYGMLIYRASHDDSQQSEHVAGEEVETSHTVRFLVTVPLNQ